MAAQAALTQYLISGLTTGSVYALTALGYCLIYNATRVVNFAQGDFLSLGGLLLYSLLSAAQVPLIPAFALAVAGTALAGALMERLCLRPARSRDLMVLIFITVAASILARGLMKIVWGKQTLPLPPLSPDEPLRLAGAVFTPQNLWVIGITLAAILALRHFFARTLTGKAMRAMAANPRAASLMGIDIRAVTTLSFALAGALGSVAGILITPITSLSYEVGVLLGLKGFAAAVLGGYGNFAGAVAGGLALGLLESFGAGMLSSAYKDVLAFVVLLLVLFLRPQGILGGKEGRS